MDIKEFVDITKRIENFYNKQVDDYEKTLWFEKLKDITPEQYEKITKNIFANNKYMPKLADILQVKKELIQSTNKEKQRVACEKCKGKGFIPYTKEVNGFKYEYIASCSCKNGDNYRYDGTKVEDRKSKYYIPSMNQLGF